MVQGLAAGVPAQAGVRVEAKAKVGAGWAGHLQQGRAEVAYARTAQQWLLMLPDSPVMREAVRNVVRK